MSARQVLSIAAAILVGCLIGGSVLGQRTAAQVLAPEQPVGRYQLSAAGAGGGTVAYVIDTATGQVWQRSRTDTKWEEFGSPTDKLTDKPKAKLTDKPTDKQRQ
jgi:hypothetical protein